MQAASRVRVVAGAALLVAASGIGAACSLDTNGLGDVASDAGPAIDATIDARADAGRDAAGGDANDAANDATPIEAGPDACASIETDCLNGVDDDCNGATDCADPACQSGYACVPAAPAGWTGYALYDDDRSTPCPSDYAAQTDTYESFVAPPASCTACACGGASGATCATTGTLDCAATAACTTGAKSVALSSACANFPSLLVDTTDYCLVTPPAVIPGSCPPSGGAVVRPAPSFGKLSRVCDGARVGGGCGAGEVCLARPTGTSHGACVSQPAGAASICPAGFGHGHTLSLDGGVTDSRGCTACTCTSPTGAACAGSATLHTQADCADPDGGVLLDDAGLPIDAGVGAPITLPADGVCHTGLVTAAESFVSAILRTSGSLQGTCAPDGGKLEGAVGVTSQTQYCCQD